MVVFRQTACDLGTLFWLWLGSFVKEEGLFIVLGSALE